MSTESGLAVYLATAIGVLISLAGLWLAMRPAKGAEPRNSAWIQAVALLVFAAVAVLFSLGWFGEVTGSGATFLLMATLCAGLMFAAVGVMRNVEDRNIFREHRLTELRRQRSQARARRLRRRLDDSLALHPRPIFCVTFDPPMSTSLPIAEQMRRVYRGVVIECNDAFALRLEASSSSAVLGMRFGDLPAMIAARSHDRLMADFIRNGHRLEDYEYTLPGRSGGERQVRLYVHGQVDDDLLRAMWILEEPPAQGAEDAEELSGEQERKLVTQIAARLLTTPVDRSKEAMMACLRDLCRYADADRAVVAWAEGQQNAGLVTHYWLEAGPPPPDTVARRGFSWARELLDTGEIISVSNLDELPMSAAEDRASLEQSGVRSAIVTPLMQDGRCVGTLSLTTSTRHRNWSLALVHPLRVIAASIGAALIRERDRNRLNDVMQELADAKERLEAENVFLQEEIRSSHDFQEIVGESIELKRCLAAVVRVAETDAPVLIYGETGTGKELIARAIHERSQRRERPIVKVNCAALPENLIESELFGHKKGAFTGAIADKPGRFELADGGTLFLDEIGEIPVVLQAKLLRVLQCGEYQRVGDDRTRSVNARIIAATNRCLEDQVAAGKFRADLFYRINTFPLTVPPLRERQGDLPLLARHFVEYYARDFDRDIRSISKHSLEALEEYPWPGNVRELEGIIQRSLITADGPVLSIDLPRNPAAVVEASETSDRVTDPEIVSFNLVQHGGISDLRSAEVQHIRRVLEAVDWRIGGGDGAAAKLGLPPSTLRSRMKKYGIERPSGPT